jgi:phosphoglycerate dehydrogenase-like enzyme
MNKLIYCGFGRAALDSGWEVAFAPHDGWSNLSSGEPDPRMRTAAVIFGQPDPALLPVSSTHWVQLTSAGYARYDEPVVRHALEARQITLTTSSSVYAEPCAEHLLAMMLAMSRRLPDLLDDQRQKHWRDLERRGESSVLMGQSVLLLGFGAIARRLTELLAPFRMDIVVIRRHVRGDEPVPVLTVDSLHSALPRADHVVCTLPGDKTTRSFVHAQRIALMKPIAFFYNVGRGTTVDQTALREALTSKQIRGAYLDVTDPEPLPADDPLWTTPRCHLTPHTAGGRATERLELMRHFVANLARYASGDPLLDRVI